jgi:hypothetical protein
MSGKQMEGDNRQRRKKAKEAREQDSAASEKGATLGASQQRTKRSDESHRDTIEGIREGKQPVIRENTPEPKPGYGRDE